MGDVAEFWLNKGIDGLRLDAFIHIAKVDLAQNYPTSESQQEPVIAEPFLLICPMFSGGCGPSVLRSRQIFQIPLYLGKRQVQMSILLLTTRANITN